jgi:hypothetical protein
MRKFYLACLLALLPACAVTPKDSDLQEYSSGHVGCAPEKVAVSEWKGGMGYSTWRAQCKGTNYRCTASTGGSSCKPE